jgi:hypothetical protein
VSATRANAAARFAKSRTSRWQTSCSWWRHDRGLKASIDHHLLKGNTFTVIDMTGYTPEQIAQVKGYVDTLPSARIVRVGF